VVIGESPPQDPRPPLKVDRLVADQEDEEEDPEEEVDQVEKETHVEGLLPAVLRGQGRGDNLRCPGEPQHQEDLHEPEEVLLLVRLLVLLPPGGPDGDAGEDEEDEVGELDEDDDALLVDELRGLEVGPGLAGGHRPEVTAVPPHLGVRVALLCLETSSTVIDQSSDGAEENGEALGVEEAEDELGPVVNSGEVAGEGEPDVDRHGVEPEEVAVEEVEDGVPCHHAANSLPPVHSPDLLEVGVRDEAVADDEVAQETHGDLAHQTLPQLGDHNVDNENDDHEDGANGEGDGSEDIDEGLLWRRWRFGDTVHERQPEESVRGEQKN